MTMIEAIDLAQQSVRFPDRYWQVKERLLPQAREAWDRLGLPDELLSRRVKDIEGYARRCRIVLPDILPDISE